MIRLH